jgi:hypothetical protein
MAWIGLPPDKLCAMIKDRSSNGDRDFAALIKHISEDKLVLWGWNPGGNREPVPVPTLFSSINSRFGRTREALSAGELTNGASTGSQTGSGRL